MSSLNQFLQITSDFESKALDRTRFQRQFVFFLHIRFWRKLYFGKFKFWSFLQRRNAKIGGSVFPSTEWIWEKNWNGKQFLKPICPYEWDFQTTFSQLVSFRMKKFKTCQMLNQYFYNASSFQLELCFFIKANSVAKLAFEKVFSCKITR